jgi:DNA-binding NarL/FixJ family response regulator
VVAWTTTAGDRQVQAVLAAGAVSVIYKDAGLDSVIDAIREAASPPLSGSIGDFRRR